MEENRKKINFGAAFSLAALMFSVYVGPGFASGTQTLTYFMTKGWFGIFLGPILCGLLVFVWCFLFFEFNRKYKPRDFRQQNDMLYTNKYVKKALGILVDVSAVVQIFLVVAAMAKGGITSSDVGTKALGVRRANVLGQIQPGIPVWQTGEESKFPGTPYVIFPGNTGGEDTLRIAAEILMGRR